MNSNWFGLESHPTDKLLHWSNYDIKAKAEKLRALYDSIPAEYHTAVEALIEASADQARSEEAEARAGDAI